MYIISQIKKIIQLLTTRSKKDKMNKVEIRRDCERLFTPRSLKDSKDLMEIFIEYFVQVINNHHADKVYSNAERDARTINQMIFSKIVHIKKIIEGIDLQSEEGIKFNGFIDPTIVVSLIRTVYETVGMFNLIFRQTKNKDEKLILYNLWVHAGLKYRQRFESLITTQENKDKYESEKEIISQLKDEIQSTNLYQSLSEPQQKKILKKLKDKDFKIRFKNNEVETFDWHNIMKPMELRSDFMDNIYTHLSLNSHPSNVSVFQFSDFFDKNNETYRIITNNNLNYLFMYLSIFAADYINLFPLVNNTFDKLSIRDQIVINFNNRMMRGKEYSINEIWKKLQ